MPLWTGSLLQERCTLGIARDQLLGRETGGECKVCEGIKDWIRRRLSYSQIPNSLLQSDDKVLENVWVRTEECSACTVCERKYQLAQAILNNMNW